MAKAGEVTVSTLVCLVGPTPTKITTAFWRKLAHYPRLAKATSIAFRRPVCSTRVAIASAIVSMPRLHEAMTIRPAIQAASGDSDDASGASGVTTMHLSRYFTLAEMTRSAKAVECSIPNDPSAQEIECLRALCTAILDPLRESLAQAIKVNSGYRCPALNRRIGGASSSQHTQGKATDIQCPGISTLLLFKTIIKLDLPFDQLIYEAASRSAQWVHVSHDPARSRGDLRIAKFGPDGKPLAYPPVSRAEALALADAGPLRGKLEYIELGDEPQ